tara:strand:+ start:7047 stop:7238 length:192 start_codon:yes stop_codon:yes gene_type:complete
MLNEDMEELIRIEKMFEEIMSQIQNGNSFGDEYSWHNARVGLMSVRILIDKLYNNSNTTAEVE